MRVVWPALAHAVSALGWGAEFACSAPITLKVAVALAVLPATSATVRDVGTRPVSLPGPLKRTGFQSEKARPYSESTEPDRTGDAHPRPDGECRSRGPDRRDVTDANLSAESFCSSRSASSIACVDATDRGRGWSRSRS